VTSTADGEALAAGDEFPAIDTRRLEAAVNS